MTVIKEGQVPLYDAVCFECDSRIRYKASEASGGYIECPICGMRIMAIMDNPVVGKKKPSVCFVPVSK